MSSFISNVRSSFNIPTSAVIELTKTCNFRCNHCYISEYNNKHMDVDKLFSMLVLLKEKGGKQITLTGGEPTLHPQFEYIYRKICSMGFSVSLFSNLFTLQNSLVKLFEEIPPTLVEATLYGFSNKVYEEITCVKNSFDNVKGNIELLLSKNINVKLKTVLTTHNFADYKEMYYYSKRANIPFNYSYVLLPSETGEEVNANELTESQVKEIIKFEIDNSIFDLKNKNINKSNSLRFNCSAGRTTFYLAYDFQIRICTFAYFTIEYE